MKNKKIKAWMIFNKHPTDYPFNTDWLKYPCFLYKSHAEKYLNRYVSIGAEAYITPVFLTPIRAERKL